MKQMTPLRRQRGITLIVGLIMLVLITLLVTAAFTLSSTNLRAVGNMQFRDEAIAAANVAVERVVSADFTAVPAASSESVNIGGAVYTVNVAAPTCIKSTAIKSLPATDPDAVQCAFGAGGAPVCFETLWEISATVSSTTGAAAATGAGVTVKQGISKRLNVTKLGSCA